MFIGFGREVSQLRLFKRELFGLEQMDLSSKTTAFIFIASWCPTGLCVSREGNWAESHSISG